MWHEDGGPCLAGWSLSSRPGHAHCTTEWVNAWRAKDGLRDDFEKEFLSTSRHVQLGVGIKITELHVNF